MENRDIDRVVRRLGRMVDRGRVTHSEAERVRAATTRQEREAAIREIRLRHARQRVEVEVRVGRLTSDEADAVISRVTRDEHPRLPRRAGPTAVSSRTAHAKDLG